MNKRGFAASASADSASIYFVRSGEIGPVKIGVAVDVIRRLQILQTGNPEELRYLVCAQVPEADAMAIERRLHDAFRGQRVRGEWFRASPQLLGLVDAVAHGANIVEELERIEASWS